MKKQAAILFACSVFASGVHGEQSDGQSHDLPKVCPYDHTTVTNIPIVYGLLAPSEETSKAIENQEFIPGGCVISPGSPKTAVLCTTCRFVYNPPRGRWDSGSWSRRSTDLKSFKHPFPPLLLSFPMPSRNTLPKQPEYSQFVTDGRASMSFVQFSTTEHLSSLKKRIEAFLQEKKLRTRYEERINSTETQRWRDIYE